jgi:pimeloyl-ACP methyl ester carboxylesterase
MHYVEEGPADGEVVLLLHGQPSWSYLYRTIIPPLAAAGYRVIAVDHLGMGRSDKPIELSFHTYETHVQRLKAFIAALHLEHITLFCHDWGGLMGLRVVSNHPESFARVVAANTTLPVLPKGTNPFRVPNPVQIDCTQGDFIEHADLNASTWPTNFQRWLIYALTAPNFTASQVVSAMTLHPLTPEEARGYDAPYPSLIYKAAVRAFPSMLAAIEEQNAPAWQTLRMFQKPFLFLAGEEDKQMGTETNQHHLTSSIPGAQGQAHERFHTGHFIQEEIGGILADRVIRFINANPLR